MHQEKHMAIFDISGTSDQHICVIGRLRCAVCRRTMIVRSIKNRPVALSDQSMVLTTDSAALSKGNNHTLICATLQRSSAGSTTGECHRWLLRDR